MTSDAQQAPDMPDPDDVDGLEEGDGVESGFSGGGLEEEAGRGESTGLSQG